MSNYIKQHLCVLGEPSLVRTVMKFIRGKGGTSNRLLDFNKIVPMPAAVQKSAEIDFMNIYDWSLSNWGSTSNACWIKRAGRAMNQLIFSTERAPAFKALSARFPKIVLELEYVDEGKMVAGRVLFKDGDGCHEKLEWDAVEGKALRHLLLDESEAQGSDLIINLEGVH